MERMEMRKHTREKVDASMHRVKFIFTEEDSWNTKFYSDMSSEDQQIAKVAWMEAEETEENGSKASPTNQ